MSTFMHSRIALDMNQRLFQMFQRNMGDVAATLDDARQFTEQLKALDITPTFIFDGNTSGMKPHAHRVRQEAATQKKEAVSKLASVIAQAEAVLSARDQQQTVRSVSRPASPVNVVSASASPHRMYSVETSEQDGISSEVVADASVVSASTTAILTTNLAALVSATVGSAACTTLSASPRRLVEPCAVHEDVSGDVDAPNVKAKHQAARDDGANMEVLRASLEHAKSKFVRAEAASRRPPSEVWSGVRAILAASFGSASVVTADDDAERHVAKLLTEGAVDFAVSTDYDTLFFGSPHVILNFMDSSKMTRMDLADVLQALQLTRKQLVDFALLCGCDFCDKVPNIGPVSALKLLHTYGSIEAMYDKELAPRLVNAPLFDYAYGRQRYFQNDPAAMLVDEPPILVTATKPALTRSTTVRKRVTIVSRLLNADTSAARQGVYTATALPTPIPLNFTSAGMANKEGASSVSTARVTHDVDHALTSADAVHDAEVADDDATTVDSQRTEPYSPVGFDDDGDSPGDLEGMVILRASGTSTTTRSPAWVSSTAHHAPAPSKIMNILARVTEDLEQKPMVYGKPSSSKPGHTTPSVRVNDRKRSVTQDAGSDDAVRWPPKLLEDAAVPPPPRPDVDSDSKRRRQELLDALMRSDDM